MMLNFSGFQEVAGPVDHPSRFVTCRRGDHPTSCTVILFTTDACFGGGFGRSKDGTAVGQEARSTCGYGELSTSITCFHSFFPPALRITASGERNKAVAVLVRVSAFGNVNRISFGYCASAASLFYPWFHCGRDALNEMLSPESLVPRLPPGSFSLFLWGSRTLRPWHQPARARGVNRTRRFI